MSGAFLRPPPPIFQTYHDVVIDTSSDPAVEVTKVYTTLADGAYGVGQEIPITVVFSAPVRSTAPRWAHSLQDTV